MCSHIHVTPSDFILFARCHFLSGQPGRALGYLESRDLISEQVLKQIEVWVTTADYQFNPPSDPFHISLLECFEAVHLAAQCLLSLEKFEDCMNLLGTLLPAIQEDPAHEILLNNSKSIDMSSSADIHIVSRLFCLMGRALDSLESRLFSIRALTTALQIDPLCLEAGQLISDRSLLSPRERAVLYNEKLDFSSLPISTSTSSSSSSSSSSLSQGPSRGWLDTHYRNLFLEDRLPGPLLPPSSSPSPSLSSSSPYPSSSNDSSSSVSSSDSSKSNSMILSFSPSPNNTLHSTATTTSSSPPSPNSYSSSSSSSSSSTSSLPPDCSPTVFYQLHQYTPSVGQLVREAERLYRGMQTREAVLCARQAYSLDEYDEKGLLIYLACLLELSLKTELFNLAHELVRVRPQYSLSWYAVGLYYLLVAGFGERIGSGIGGGPSAGSGAGSKDASSGKGSLGLGKLDQAHRFLRKATRMNPRLPQPWLALSLTLSRQEEPDLALSAARTASRLAPGDPLPLICMSRELVKLNQFSMALHMLFNAASLCLPPSLSPSSPSSSPTSSSSSSSTTTSSSSSPLSQCLSPLSVFSSDGFVIFNEIGSILLKLDRIPEALSYFQQAVKEIQQCGWGGRERGQEQGKELLLEGRSRGGEGIHKKTTSTSFSPSPSPFLSASLKHSIGSVYWNLGTTLRKTGRLNEAQDWFDLCVSLSPREADVHFQLGYCLHLQGNFDSAIAYYHQSLSLSPHNILCNEMLSRCLHDRHLYLPLGSIPSSSTNSSSSSSMYGMKNQDDFMRRTRTSGGGGGRDVGRNRGSRFSRGEEDEGEEDGVGRRGEGGERTRREEGGIRGGYQETERETMYRRKQREVDEEEEEEGEEGKVEDEEYDQFDGEGEEGEGEYVEDGEGREFSREFVAEEEDGDWRESEDTHPRQYTPYNGREEEEEERDFEREGFDEYYDEIEDQLLDDSREEEDN